MGWCNTVSWLFWFLGFDLCGFSFRTGLMVCLCDVLISGLEFELLRLRFGFGLAVSSLLVFSWLTFWGLALHEAFGQFGFAMGFCSGDGFCCGMGFV